jgi:hypothetical protein
VPVSVPVPPPSVPAPLQPDKAKGRIAKHRAKAPDQRILDRDRAEGFIVVIPLKVVDSCRFLIFKFNNSRTILSSF